MGYLLAVFLQAAFFMQMILSYCPVVFVVCKKMINICAEYGASWDIKFNSAKSQCISFGVVSHLLSLLHCMTRLFSGYISLNTWAAFSIKVVLWTMLTVCRSFMVILIISCLFWVTTEMSYPLFT